MLHDDLDWDERGQVWFPIVMSATTMTLKILDTCHTQGVAHLDVKPENIFFTSLKQNDGRLENSLQLGDFSLSLQLAAGEYAKLPHSRGTFEFMAAEVRGELEIEGSQTHKVAGRPSDIWSVGIQTVLLLIGSFPPHDFLESFSSSRECDDGSIASAQEWIEMQHGKNEDFLRKWRTIPDPIRMMIGDCLRKYPPERLSASALLAKYCADEMQVDQELQPSDRAYFPNPRTGDAIQNFQFYINRALDLKSPDGRCLRHSDLSAASTATERVQNISWKGAGEAQSPQPSSTQQNGSDAPAVKHQAPLDWSKAPASCLAFKSHYEKELGFAQAKLMKTNQLTRVLQEELQKLIPDQDERRAYLYILMLAVINGHKPETNSSFFAPKFRPIKDNWGKGVNLLKQVAQRMAQRNLFNKL
eukprot:TRINITY_DN2130_c0_g1_i4.p1 TRINITY_DN2130_c0_g1~~TRINITY_DN2130_c0_g1_i4.p1  ORF type:complete len:415 (-),score=75.20 TRINITY_DN2130_c0_g1_i4:159-1403(-)